jgi:hypothetical protein
MPILLNVVLSFGQGFVAFADIESKTALANGDGWQNPALGPDLNGAAVNLVPSSQIVGGDKSGFIGVRRAQRRIRVI